jgi:hypothetical protein
LRSQSRVPESRVPEFQSRAEAPSALDQDRADPLSTAIEAALACAQAAGACADACVAEGDKALVQCIRLNLDCADVCQTAAMVATRRAGANAPVVIGLLMLAEALCRDCAAEAGRHALPACRRSADLARACADACLEARTAVAREQLQ